MTSKAEKAARERIKTTRMAVGCDLHLCEMILEELDRERARGALYINTLTAVRKANKEILENHAEVSLLPIEITELVSDTLDNPTPASEHLRKFHNRMLEIGGQHQKQVPDHNCIACQYLKEWETLAK